MFKGTVKFFSFGQRTGLLLIVILFQKKGANISKEQKDACDVVTTGINKNVITSADARRILRTAVGLK